MIFIIPKLRGTDAQGSGAYGAPRGDRTHKGVDYACRPGSMVFSAIPGRVTRLGWCYKKTAENEAKGLTELRLIEIRDDKESLIRYMYVLPAPHIRKNLNLISGEFLGIVQRLPYKGITQHVHVDVRQMVGRRRKFVDPVKYFEEFWL